MSTSIIRPILSCLGLRRKQGKRSSKQFIEYERVQEKGIPHTNEIPDDVQIAADRFLATLLDADVASSTSSELHDSLRAATKDLVLTESLTSWLGQKILAGIQYAIEHKVEIGETMKHAIERAVGAAWDFAKEHPVYATIIALGVLVEIAPWVLGWLGFAEIGIVEGSWAALWQARFAGYVPKGSLFSYLQRLGMTLRLLVEDTEKEKAES